MLNTCIAHQFKALVCITLGLVLPHSSAAAAPTPAEAKAAFEKLKSLKGEWIDTSGDGDQKSGAKVTYRVVATGSAVIETLFPGQDHEMVTVYHLDGPNLVLTHYCAARNQPRMKAVSIAADRIEFEFTDGSNINPSKDMHMHSGRLAWVGPEIVASEWVGWADGKPSEHSVKFRLKRLKGVGE